jgi:hypothetical protein
MCLDKTLAHLLHDWVADVFAGHLKGHHDFRPLLRPGRTGISTGKAERDRQTMVGFCVTMGQKLRSVPKSLFQSIDEALSAIKLRRHGFDSMQSEM